MSDSFGQIAGGVVGAVAGFFIGGPAGAIAGATLGYGAGSFIDPPPGPLIKAPRLDNQVFQSNVYGSPVQKLYGTVSSKCFVIWLENGTYDEVVTQEQQGGKGGGGGATVETVEYFATFAVSVAEANEGSIIRKIWLGGELFFNLDSDDPATVIQSNENAKKFTYYDGSQDLPDPRMEGEFGVGQAPNYKGESIIVFYDISLKKYGNTLAGAPIKVEYVENNLPSAAFIHSNDIAGPYADGSFFEAVPCSISAEKCVSVAPGWNNSFISPTTYHAIERDFEGDLVDTGVVDLAVAGLAPSGLNDLGIPVPDGDVVDLLPGVTNRFPNGMYQIRNGVTIQGDAVTETLYRDGSSITRDEMRAIALDDDGFVYVAYEISGDSFIEKRDATLSLLDTIQIGLNSSSSAFGGAHLWHDSGRIYYGRGNHPFDFEVYDDNLKALLFTFSISPPASVRSNTAGFAVDNGILIAGSQTTDLRIHYISYNVASLSNSTKTLGSIISEISSDVGVETMDVSEINSIVVRGYRTGNDTARGIFSQLQAAFLFDIIPDGYSMKAVVRLGKTSSATIEYDDLNAATSQGNEIIRIKTNREMEHQLPWKYNLKYLDVNREYDIGSQSQIFPSASRTERTEELPIVFNADEAAKIVDSIITLAHIERDDFEFSIPQKYLDLKVSDIVTLVGENRSYTIRLTEITETVDQILECSGKLSDPNVYTSTASGAEGTTPPDTIPIILDASIVLVDAPLIENNQDNPAFASVMWGQGSWPGGTLYQSIDNGQVYNPILSQVNIPVVGQALNVIPAHDGFTIDRSSSLSIDVKSGSFSSITEDQMMTGQNYCVYGADGRWEVIQFSNAALQGNGTVDITTFVRGARGTEDNTGLHETGDYIILFDSSIADYVSSSLESLTLDRLYKAVTFGRNIADASSITFSYDAVNLKPLQPLYAEGSKVGSIWTITVYARTRFGGSFWVTGTPPIDETDLNYELDVLDGNDVLVTLQTTKSAGVDTFVFTYDSAAISLDIAVYQISARVGRGIPLITTILST